MKTDLKQFIQTALLQLQEENLIPQGEMPDIQIQYAKDRQHGDFASNIALILAKQLKKSPQIVAGWVIDRIPSSSLITRIEMAGPGFINFFVSENIFQTLISDILDKQSDYGKNTTGLGQKIHMEIVSANPTGPLHVGHGRLAAFDSSLANLLKTLGYEVHCEYYVNDAGRQMSILALSIWLRYLESSGESLPFEFPESAYQGAYVNEIAQQIYNEQGSRFFLSKEILQGWELSDISDPDRLLDDLIDHARQSLGSSEFALILEKGMQHVLSGIQKDLSDFRVNIDEWFLESQLWKKNEIEESLRVLSNAGYIYEKEEAKWFAATRFGDEKDRVVLRKNGQYTYFAADIAYHWDKFKRGYTTILDTFGSDHHGYTKRIQGVASALGYDPEKIKCFLIQFAILYRKGQKISMSTRKGVFVTLRELFEEVGTDAARFFYVMRKYDQHLDFDLDLAKSSSNENPVYYIQYAHARICSVFRQLSEKEIVWDKEKGMAYLDKLDTEHEKALLRCLFRYSDTLQVAAQNFEPQILAHYLHELANYFHSYYNAYQFLVEDVNLRNARLNLILASCYVIANGLKILGVSAPDSM